MSESDVGTHSCFTENSGCLQTTHLERHACFTCRETYNVYTNQVRSIMLKYMLKDLGITFADKAISGFADDDWLLRWRQELGPEFVDVDPDELEKRNFGAYLAAQDASDAKSIAQLVVRQFMERRAFFLTS